MATVRLRGQLEKLAGGGSVHEIAGDTVTALLEALEGEFEALEGWILDERGVLRRHINVFVNGELAKPDAPVADGDKIEILPAISGDGLAGTSRRGGAGELGGCCSPGDWRMKPPGPTERMIG